jgi:hypothetical protein
MTQDFDNSKKSRDLRTYAPRAKPTSCAHVDGALNIVDEFPVFESQSIDESKREKDWLQKTFYVP